MVTTRIKKVLMDLWGNKVRTVLVALSIAVGVFAVGVVTSSYFIVQKDMAADYEVANAHTARIYCQEYDPALLNSLADIPGVEAVEGRYNLWAKAAGADGKLYEINLDSLTSIEDTRVDRLIYISGATRPEDGEILLERQGAEGLGLGIGDTVALTLSDGSLRSLKVVGSVHDVIANPFTFTTKTSGYVSPQTMADLGGSLLPNYVSLVTSGEPTDVAQVQAVAERVAAAIESSGVTVYNINISNPGKHPADATISTVLLLMGALAVMAVLLSAFLVTNTVSALMGQQVRQIGVMKALGATMGQMLAIYTGLILAFGVLALLVAVPLGALAAYALTHWLITMLNATPSPFTLPAASLAVQVLVGLAVPLFAGLVPVWNGARLTIRQAITSYGLATPGQPDLFDRLLEAVRGLPRPLLLSLRNTFRRKGRLALTLSTLVLAGAIFIAVFSARTSLFAEIDQSLGYYQADVNAELSEPYRLDEVLQAVEGMPGVQAVEGWLVNRVNVLKTDGTNSDQVILYAPPADTRLVDPSLTAGRWLLPTDEQAVVIENHFTDLRPDVGVGDVIQVHIGEQDYPFTVVGIFRLSGSIPNPFLYTNYATLAKIMNSEGWVNSLRITTGDHEADSQYAVAQALQARFEEQGVKASLQTGSEVANLKRSQVNLLIILLLLMAVLIALVGGLGLMGTMSMNVLERTREIGVMRSIGAENGAIFQMVVVEGVLVGGISWVLGLLAAIPVTQVLDQGLGERLMSLPLVYRFSLEGGLIWLGIVLVLAAIASLLPARNAVRLTVRDVLAYE